jgi:excisionase family DNA binding protein
MAQKFSSIDEAAGQLGVSKDRLNQIREAGKIRAYRDGASWKFRQDDIDRLAQDGIPAIGPGESDISLDLGDEPALPTPRSAEASGLDLDMADEPAAGPASDISLEDVEEPTVAGESEIDEMALDMGDSIDMSDSILLSETELGESTGRPPSTIIGRAELDADLDLAPKGKEKAKPLHESDVQLAPASDIISAGDSEMALDMEPPSPSDNFQGLEELEVDLEAESSRILSPEDVAKAQSAAKAQPAKSAPSSDLELAPSDSDAARAASDVGLGGEAASGTGLTGLSALELEDDDEQVLGEGSDVTLSSESSGINIISPSDSGLALDEVPLDLSGSAAMGSSFDLGGALEEEEVALEPLAIGDVSTESAIGGAFQLTPIGEDAAEDEKDSSQVIALDDISEEAGEPLSVGLGDSGMMGEEFGSVGLAPGAVIVEPTSETPFSGWVVAGLSTCLLMLALSGMMVFDLVRNIWSWDGVATLNSPLLEVLNPLL